MDMTKLQADNFITAESVAAACTEGVRWAVVKWGSEMGTVCCLSFRFQRLKLYFSTGRCQSGSQTRH